MGVVVKGMGGRNGGRKGRRKGKGLPATEVSLVRAPFPYSACVFMLYIYFILGPQRNGSSKRRTKRNENQKFYCCC